MAFWHCHFYSQVQLYWASCDEHFRVGWDCVRSIRKRNCEQNGILRFAEKVCTERIWAPQSECLALCELIIKTFCHFLRTSRAVHRCVKKNVWIRELPFHIFLEANVSVTLLSCAQFLQLVLFNSQAKTWMPYNFGVPIAFKEKLYCHAMALDERVN